jgi:hypothetical protein
LRFSRFFDAEDGYENSRNEQQKPHRQPLLTPAEKRQPDAFCFRSWRDEALLTSPFGPKRTFRDGGPESAFGGEADIAI